MNGPDEIRLDAPRRRLHRVEGHQHFHVDEPEAIAETVQGSVPEREAMPHGEPR